VTVPNKGWENLQRGKTPAERTRLAHAMNERVAGDRADEEATEQAAFESPVTAQKRIYAKLMRVLDEQLNAQLRARGGDKRQMMSSTVDLAKEVRQTADRVLEVIRAEGATAQADEFFAQLGVRLSAAGVRAPRPYSRGA
jgi:glycosyltransferase A (GT-A) superfamily protein (DUF2064 family)